MPRPKAPCGTYSAYKRHKRDGERVDAACQKASVERSREYSQRRRAAEPAEGPRGPQEQAPKAVDRRKSLEWNLRLIEKAMGEVMASKLAPLSKRHSELLNELASLGGAKEEVDPFDEFFSGQTSNVVGFPTPEDREVS